MDRSPLLRLAAAILLLALPSFLPVARADSESPPPTCVQHGICVDCAPAEGQRLCTFRVCSDSITEGYFCSGCFDECVPFP
ncbi:MAG TPA: hypothetical protein VF173_07680 [Thermoanaerobaculia bacterium]|nr:hypothetical protein [Thermoanaerobaculia bacterium]